MTYTQQIRQNCRVGWVSKDIGYAARLGGGVFLAERGSWNREKRSGYQVAFIGFKDGKASEDPVPFLTWTPSRRGCLPDGSLVVADDSSGNEGIIHYRS